MLAPRLQLVTRLLAPTLVLAASCAPEAPQRTEVEEAAPSATRRDEAPGPERLEVLRHRAEAERALAAGRFDEALRASRAELDAWEGAHPPSAWAVRDAERRAGEIELLAALDADARRDLGRAAGRLSNARDALREEHWERATRHLERRLELLEPHLPPGHRTLVDNASWLDFVRGAAMGELPVGDVLALSGERWAELGELMRACAMLDGIPLDPPPADLGEARVRLEDTLRSADGSPAELAQARLLAYVLSHLDRRHAEAAELVAGFADAIERLLGRDPRAALEAALEQEVVKYADLPELGEHLAALSGPDGGAEPAYRAHLHRMLELHGPEHPEVADAYSALGFMCLNRLRFDDSHSAFDAALRARRATRSDAHPDTLLDASNLALALLLAGEDEAARATLDECAARYRALAKGVAGIAALEGLPADLLLDALEDARRRGRELEDPPAARAFDELLAASRPASDYATRAPLAHWEAGTEIGRAELSAEARQRLVRGSAPELARLLDEAGVSLADEDWEARLERHLVPQMEAWAKGEGGADLSPALRGLMEESARRGLAPLAPEDRAGRSAAKREARKAIERGEELAERARDAAARAEWADAERLLREATEPLAKLELSAGLELQALAAARLWCELGELLHLRDDLAGAEATLDRAAELAGSVPSTLLEQRTERNRALRTLELTLRRRGRHARAAEVRRELREHPDLRVSLEGVAWDRLFGETIGHQVAGRLPGLEGMIGATDLPDEYLEHLSAEQRRQLEQGFEKARADTARAMGLLRVPGMLSEARAALQKGRARAALSRYEEARSLLDESEADAARLRVQVLEGRAQCLVELGRLDEAERLADELAGLREARGRSSFPRELESPSRSLRARIHGARGRYDEALSELEPLGPPEEAAPGDAGERLRLGLHAAELRSAGASARGDHEAALEEARRAMRFAEALWQVSPIAASRRAAMRKPVPEDLGLSPERMEQMRSIGLDAGDLLQLSMGAMQQQVGLFTSMNSLDLHGEDRLLAGAARRLASLLAESEAVRDRRTALELFARALELQRAAEDPSLYVTCVEMALLLHAGLARTADALPFCVLAGDALDARRARFDGDELEQAAWFGDLLGDADPYSTAIELRLTLDGETVGPAFDDLERGRGRSLMRLLRRREVDLDALVWTQISESKDERLVARYRAAAEKLGRARGELVEIDAELAELLRSEGAPDERLLERRERAVETEREALLERRAMAGPYLGRADDESLVCDQVLERLEPGELLLGYELGERGAWLFALERAKEPQAYRLAWPDGDEVRPVELELAVRALLSRFSSEFEPVESKRDGVELARALVPEPVRDRVRRARRVLLLPDASLHVLPFEALPVPAGEGARGEELWLHSWPPIVVGPSATFLLRERGSREPARPGPRSLLAVGDPPYGEAGKSASAAGPIAELFRTFPPLPRSRLEVEAIAARVRAASPEARVDALVAERASLERLRESVRRPTYLHFAVHGLAAGPPWTLESGLALAGAGSRPPRESILGLGELLDAWPGRLAGTELVTLSACRTYVGPQAPGEGAVALHWGFLLAGARAVIATRWSVRDDASALFMTKLYERLLAGVPRPEALRGAQRWLAALDRREAARQRVDLLGEPRSILDGIEDDDPYWDERPYDLPDVWAAYVLLGEPD